MPDLEAGHLIVVAGVADAIAEVDAAFFGRALGTIRS
jgi:hypothetical protein